MAAKDYFFEDPIKRAYFENFTNLVPMDRHGSLRESLRLAVRGHQQGYILLIFPEGTRSTTGVMVDFKPSIGYSRWPTKWTCCRCTWTGTHEALPKGARAAEAPRDIAAHIGPLLRYEAAQARDRGHAQGGAYREASRIVELAVRKLAPRGQRQSRAGVAPPTAK